ncbi:expressed protein [Phakopsora pachyrhizi]|uniref:Expressed protein n=1 Tax=Phakopsora pachyrhizi TaxID=170000 RepID=A0AAV0ALQ9_PHAPC|nr:expressed protein [Phakopsora pachyrhizi]
MIHRVIALKRNRNKILDPGRRRRSSSISSSLIFNIDSANDIHHQNDREPSLESMRTTDKDSVPRPPIIKRSLSEILFEKESILDYLQRKRPRILRTKSKSGQRLSNIEGIEANEDDDYSDRNQDKGFKNNRIWMLVDRFEERIETHERIGKIDELKSQLIESIKTIKSSNIDSNIEECDSVLNLNGHSSSGSSSSRRRRKRFESISSRSTSEEDEHVVGSRNKSDSGGHKRARKI